MHAPIGLWPRTIAFLVHTVGSTAHPDVHYTNKRTSAIISTLFIAIGVVECLFGHTPYTLIFNTSACAIMIWAVIHDQFFSPKHDHKQGAGIQSSQEKQLEADWAASSKKLESELQKLEQKVSANLSTSGKQQLESYLETIRGKMEENTKGCERMAGVIGRLRGQHKKVDTDYLDSYHEKLEECTKDANHAARKASIYLASIEGGQQDTILRQANIATTSGRATSIPGYLENHVGQLLQLIERIRVPAEPIEERPPVLRLGRNPIIIQGLAQNSMFIQQLDENRAVISSSPWSAQMQPLAVANGL